MSLRFIRRIVAASLFSLPAAAQQPVATPSVLVPQIVTAGVGEAKVTPDRARIQIAVQTRAVTAAAAGTANARKQRSVIDTLRALGLTAEQITTTAYTVQPDMQYDKDGGAPKVVGYVVTNSIRAELSRFDLVGPAIDASLAKGANNIDQLELYSSRAEDARRASLADAVVQARADAQVMARAAGGSLGRLLEVASAEAPSPIQPLAMAAMRQAKVSSTPIEPGETTVRTSVTARWEFIPPPR